MLIYLSFSCICLFIIFSWGVMISQFSGKISKNEIQLNFIETYFLGFTTLSVLSSYLSVFIPLNSFVLIAFFMVSVISFFPFRKELSVIKSISKTDLYILLSLVLIILMYASNGIKNEDSGVYHAQAIQWIQKFSVVPGLGNLHGRFAFNSLFFTLGAVFTFDTNSILIYPLNTITLIVFLTWEFFFIKEKINQLDWKNTLLGISIMLFCLWLFPKNYSSPTPDLICSIINIYIFQWVFTNDWKILNISSVIIICLIFLNISYKLSSLSLLFIIAIFFTEKKNSLKTIGLSSILGLIILAPFFIRNYYLSGYLIYPFPAIDIFSVDWKIPIESVINEKVWIESWARIPKKMPEEVLSLPIYKWIIDWFINQPSDHKLLSVFALIGLPFISIFSFIKKQYKSFIISSILIINILYWLFTAPDPRFLLGTLIFTSSFVVYSLVFLIKKEKLLKRIKIMGIILLGLIAIDTTNIHGIGLVSFATNPKRIFIPTSFPETKTETINQNNLMYYRPIESGLCNNSPLPCTPYQNTNLILRGKTLQEGFRISKKKN